MRIITGKAKGVKLLTLEGENTRPTPERVKEAVFSSIQFDIEGRTVLDLFAGSGQMGLEALSRGADRAVLVDAAKAATNVIAKNVEKTRLGEMATVLCADYSEYLRAAAGRERFDLVFLDPPYASGLITAALEKLLAGRLLKPTSLIVCESDTEDVFFSKPSLADRFEVVKKNRYGIVHVTVLSPKNEGGSAL